MGVRYTLIGQHEPEDMCSAKDNSRASLECDSLSNQTTVDVADCVAARRYRHCICIITPIVINFHCQFATRPTNFRSFGDDIPSLSLKRNLSISKYNTKKLKSCPQKATNVFL